MDWAAVARGRLRFPDAKRAKACGRMPRSLCCRTSNSGPGAFAPAGPALLMQGESDPEPAQGERASASARVGLPETVCVAIALGGGHRSGSSARSSRCTVMTSTVWFCTTATIGDCCRVITAATCSAVASGSTIGRSRSCFADMRGRGSCATVRSVSFLAQPIGLGFGEHLDQGDRPRRIPTVRSGGTWEPRSPTMGSPFESSTNQSGQPRSTRSRVAANPSVCVPTRGEPSIRS